MPKTVSFTYQTLVLTDITAVQFQRQGATWVGVATGTVREAGGKSYISAVTFPLTPGQQTTLETFITNNVLAPFNAQEGV